ncbi:hypothetical protein ACF3NS_01440 [Arsenicicoccus cauae]|uniref:hypothetical protein n=1 Tax=Arsenicicoccus cauae TaxID=2663847 RepID=UPI00370D8476
MTTVLPRPTWTGPLPARSSLPLGHHQHAEAGLEAVARADPVQPEEWRRLGRQLRSLRAAGDETLHVTAGVSRPVGGAKGVWEAKPEMTVARPVDGEALPLQQDRHVLGLLHPVPTTLRPRWFGGAGAPDSYPDRRPRTASCGTSV